MELFLIAFTGVAVGLLIGWFIGHNGVMQQLTDTKSHLAASETSNSALREQVENTRREYSQQVTNLRNDHVREIEAMRSEQARQVEVLRQDQSRQLNVLRSDHAHALEVENNRWQERFESMKVELAKIQQETLNQKQEALATENSRQISQLLEPVRRQISEFDKLTRDTHTASEVSRRELQGAFSATMKLFQQQQQQAVEQMQRQTERISNDAASLSKALRGDNRAQGRWGEMVLEHILEESGLRRDHEFTLQSSQLGNQGQQQRPDVVVQLPDSRSVIIDSKVSLTAYSSAIEVQDSDPAVAEKLLLDHARSVRRHVDELAAKDYSSSQPGAVEMVMMFLPTDSSYIAAVRSQPDIIEYALRKRVAIITPSNLLLSLKLVYHLWQHERQERNVEKIVARGNELYSRMAGFMESFNEIGNMLSRADKIYETAGKRLTGKGGLVSQFEMLRKLGLTPKKRIPGAELSAEEIDLIEEDNDD